MEEALVVAALVKRDVGDGVAEPLDQPLRRTLPRLLVALEALEDGRVREVLRLGERGPELVGEGSDLLADERPVVAGEEG